MDIEKFGTDLVERYLHQRGLRYHRDRHGGRFSMMISTARCDLLGQLDVHGPDRGLLDIRISEFRAATERTRLMELVNEWNRETRWPKAFVYETADPARIGVAGENAYPLTHGIHFQALATFVDTTIGGAIELFEWIRRTVDLPSAQTLERWLGETG